MASGANNPLLGLLGYQLRRASAAIMDELVRDLSDIGLRPIEASILVVVSANPMITLSDVGRELGVQRANMTPLVGALERGGLIQRQQVDGRSQGLCVTEQGALVVKDAFMIMRANEKKMIDKACGSHMSEMRQILSKLWT